jgi:alkylation response protein AidB-like acyl-CoA dehydrogenase
MISMTLQLTDSASLGSEYNDLNDRERAFVERAAIHAADFANRAADHDREKSYPFENMERLHDSGYMKQCIPSEFGGEDASLKELCLAQERLAQGCAASALGANMHSFFVGAAAETHRSGAKDMSVIFGMVAQGKVTAGGALSEAESADPFNASSCTVERVDGGYRLNGRKVFGSNTPINPMLLFSGMLHEDGSDRILSFFLPKGSPGTEIIDDWDTMGMRGTGSLTVAFKDCIVPHAMLFNEEKPAGRFGGTPFQAAFLVWFETTVAAVYTGIAVAARDFARATAAGRDRKPYGQVKHYPGVQYGLAEMYIAVEASRAFVRRSATRLGDPSWRDMDAQALAFAVKQFGTESAIRVVDTAMEVVGGGAFFKRLPLERMYRDARAGAYHPPSRYDAYEAIGKADLKIPYEQSPRFL